MQRTGAAQFERSATILPDGRIRTWLCRFNFAGHGTADSHRVAMIPGTTARIRLQAAAGSNKPNTALPSCSSVRDFSCRGALDDSRGGAPTTCGTQGGRQHAMSTARASMSKRATYAVGVRHVMTGAITYEAGLTKLVAPALWKTRKKSSRATSEPPETGQDTEEAGRQSPAVWRVGLFVQSR